MFTLVGSFASTTFASWVTGPFTAPLVQLDGRPTPYFCRTFACELPTTSPSKTQNAPPEGREMRRLSFVHCLFVILVVSAAVPATARLSVAWQTDYGAALAEPKRTNKPLFVEFYATWCSACRSLDRTSLRAADVEKALERFVAIASTRNFRVPISPASSTYPVFLLCTLYRPMGNILASSIGVIDFRELLSLLERAQ